MEQIKQFKCGRKTSKQKARFYCSVLYLAEREHKVSQIDWQDKAIIIHSTIMIVFLRGGFGIISSGKMLNSLGLPLERFE